MGSFIEQLSHRLIDTHGAGLGELCVVFPSRRACVFMQDALARISPTATWSPALYAIEDFVPLLQPANILDTISLTFELYPLYHQLFPNDTFEQFYNWGQLIVADFDEVDRHLVDGDKLFQNLAALKRIDTSIEAWLNEDGQPSPQQAAYMRFWDGLGILYGQLRKRLQAQGMASGGMALRQLAQRLGAERPALPWRKVVFAGFNALSPAEEQVMLSLLRWDLAECYWDLDAWYVEQPQQEAGHFFRALRDRWEAALPMLRGHWNWIGDHLRQTPKRMVVTAVPKRVGQAKAAGLLLSSMAEGVAPESVALVLPDENLLFPVLHSLPADLGELNVTMGYPLRNTPLFGLVDGLLNLHENAARLRPTGKGEPVYYFRDIVGLLRHPYVQAIASQESRDTMQRITQENMIYVSPGHFLRYGDDSLLRFLFSPWRDVQEAMGFLLALFERLRAAFEAKQKLEKPLPTVETEVLYHFFTLTQKLQAKLGKYIGGDELSTFRRIYKEVILGAGVPFAGEPLEGLQVMGMLETRVLDFDRLIVLSVNEGILPPKQSADSLIPYSLRKAFGLPTYEERDAIYAYHFYRLLQRASQVHLLYDAVPDSLGGGEKSRFVSQIEAELMRENAQLEVVHGTFSFPAEPEAPPPVSVPKGPDLIQQLLAFGAEKGFSPSALNTYLNCSLQFYFRYLLGLKEKEQPEETVEDNTFGLVLHGVMEQLYQPWVGHTVTAAQIAGLLDGVEKVVEDVFRDKARTDSYKTGRNRLLIGVIRDLVRQMLELDMAYAPFELVALEQELEAQLDIDGGAPAMKVRGFVDRIDQKEGRIRIIDYKTGAVGGLHVKEFAELREGPPKKEVFQLGAYAYLYHSVHRPGRAVHPGIFAMRNLADGYLGLEHGPQRHEDFDLQCAAEFEGLLRNIFEEMMQAELPFAQTDDDSRCRFCAFKTICSRH